MAALCPLCKLERLKLRGTRRAFHPMFQKGRLDVLAEANGSSENFVQGDIPHREASLVLTSGNPGAIRDVSPTRRTASALLLQPLIDAASVKGMTARERPEFLSNCEVIKTNVALKAITALTETSGNGIR
mmetsp:Transcript_65057/g.155351  ORF Transcript_65057/g.155351 Transcript_65057/m.155351 type:complete len:130 (+) Transcript_65057:24-413(+)